MTVPHADGRLCRAVALARAGWHPAAWRDAAAAADELIITTITHDHADRVRSYELLAAEWSRR